MYPGYISAAVAVVIVLFFLTRRGGVGGTRIQSPKLGFLNLKGAAAALIVAQDQRTLAPMFSGTIESSAEPPQCDVLFIYCDISRHGRILGTNSGLRELIQISGARVVVVASDNSGESYGAAVKETGTGKANLVLTLERRGAVFPAFYKRLFALMMQGTSMPVAWVKLAPQIPGQVHADCPEAIFSAEAGQIAFK